MLSHNSFRERLLKIMDRKHHWAWPHFSGGDITRGQLKTHFQQEYEVYVRDFPVYLARIHGNNPPADVRRLLAETIYEEDTGGLSLGQSHPELFMDMMAGLGYARKDFDRINLLPASRPYRRWLDTVSSKPDWIVGAAVLTIFVEGSVKDREEILKPSPPKSKAEIEDIVSNHPLVRHHGLSPGRLNLVRAHQMVESGHRHAAYDIVTTHAEGRQQEILRALERSLTLWLRYRDGIAQACGFKRPRA